MKTLFKVQVVFVYNNKYIQEPINYHVLAKDDVKAKKMVTQLLISQGNVTDHKLYARPVGKLVTKDIFC